MRALLDILFPPRETERVVRALTEETLFERLSPTPVEHCPNTISLFQYRDPLIESLIIEAKFNNNRKAHSLLGIAVSEFLTDWQAEQQLFEAHELAIVPVPLSRRRMLEREYNQVERVLAGVEHQIRIESALKRTRETLPQTSLSKIERLKNMNGVFAVQGSINTDTIYMVVDDVITTGTTMRSAMSALHSAGATHIYGLSFAH